MYLAEHIWMYGRRRGPMLIVDIYFIRIAARCFVSVHCSFVVCAFGRSLCPDVCVCVHVCVWAIQILCDCAQRQNRRSRKWHYVNWKLNNNKICNAGQVTSTKVQINTERDGMIEPTGKQSSAMRVRLCEWAWFTWIAEIFTVSILFYTYIHQEIAWKESIHTRAHFHMGFPYIFMR